MTTAKNKYRLYIDDTGSRDPDNESASQTEQDKMDCFGLGGILLKESDVDHVREAHTKFCAEQNITYPLHSHSIRRGRRNFAWLKTPEKAGVFMPALETFVLSLPIIALACIVHRPGYVARYKEKYRDGLWFMCRTAFTILVERAAKFVDERGGAMEVYFEQTGRKEDRDLIGYMRDLKERGLDFDPQNSESYAPFKAEDFKRLCLGKPFRRTKDNPMIQIADLVLFPMAKAGYQPGYRPYVQLKAAGKLIDCHIAEGALSARGIKYSCFDADKTKAQLGS